MGNYISVVPPPSPCNLFLKQGNTYTNKIYPTDYNAWQDYWRGVGASSVSRAMHNASPYEAQGLSLLMGNPIGGLAG